MALPKVCAAGAFAVHMQGMTNVNNRTRVQAGIKTGGQFAAEAHREPEGVLLTHSPSPLDEAAVASLGDKIRDSAAVEHGRWARRQDKGYMRELPTPPLPPELVELNRQAKDFESLSREEQGEVLNKLKLDGARHLLEPGQTLGNDKVQVTDDLDTEDGNIGLALTAQKLVAEARLPGTVTLTEVGKDSTKFTVQDGSLKHGVTVGSTYLSFSSESAEDEDYTRNSWLYRADIGVYGGSVFEQDREQDLRKHYEAHRDYAVIMDVVASSSFRDHEENLGELDRNARTAVLMTDGTENVLDISGDQPVLKTEDGKSLHPSMARGYLDHMAAQTGHADGDAFVSSLREVFRETDRRFIP